MNVWRPIDAIAHWLMRLPIIWQQRAAVFATLASFPLMLYGFRTGEPFLVYEMSAFALFLSGVTWVQQTETESKLEESDQS